MSEIEVKVENAPRFANVPKGVITADISLGARCLWVLLATYAWNDGAKWYVTREVLAQELHASHRSVTTWVKELEEAGLLAVERRRESGLPNVFTIIHPSSSTEEGDNPVQNLHTPPAKSAHPSAKSAHKKQEEEEGRASRRGRSVPRERKTERTKAVVAREARVPDDFPDELRPHARVVFKVLKQVAAEKGANEVSALALARMMMGRPRKPFVRCVHDWAAWQATNPRPVRDVVGSYRNWLDRESTLEGLEMLNDNGVPTSTGTEVGVVRPRRESPSDLLKALGPAGEFSL